MSVFKTQCFLFLRNPRGGVEDLDRMQAAGFGGVFCNIGDHQASEWENIILPRALERGMFCGPWARTTDESNVFSEDKLDQIIACAEAWGSPLVVNSESELQGTGDKWTTLIAERCSGLDAALSMEPVPFDNVSWWQLGQTMPVLPQCFHPLFPADSIEWALDLWHGYGVKCVFPTFGTYGGATPGVYPLNAPYSLYTGDDCGGNYAAWSPREHSYQGCIEEPPDGGGDLMEKIGSQDGINGFMDWLRQQPGVKPRGPGYNENDISTWPMSDKIERTLRILVKDHDEQAS